MLDPRDQGIPVPYFVEQTIAPSNPIAVADRYADVVQAGKYLNIHNLRRTFNAEGDVPLWLLCLSRERHLQEQARVYHTNRFRALIDENQSPRIVEPAEESLGITCAHIDTHEKMKGADDLEVVTCALTKGYRAIITADKREASNSPYPHLTKVVKDLARSVTRAFFLEGRERPEQLYSFPMVVHVPAFSRQSSWEDVVSLLDEQRDVIREHLAGQKTLVLGFNHFSKDCPHPDMKPKVVSHADLIASVWDEMNGVRKPHRGMKSREKGGLALAGT